MDILLLHLVNEHRGIVSDIDRARFKLIKLFHGLGVQVLAVNKEYHLLDPGFLCEDLCCLETGEGLTRASGVPYVGVLIRELRPVNELRSCIDLVRSHYHDGFVHIIENRIPKKHPSQMVSGEECDREIPQIGDTDIVFVSPEEGEAVENVLIAVGKILRIYTVGNYEALDVAVQTDIGVLLVPHYLVNSLSDVHAPALQLDLYERETIA